MLTSLRNNVSCAYVKVRAENLRAVFSAKKNAPQRGAFANVCTYFFYYFLRLYAAIARARAPNSAAMVAGSGTRAMLKPSALS